MAVSQTDFPAPAMGTGPLAMAAGRAGGGQPDWPGIARFI